MLILLVSAFIYVFFVYGIIQFIMEIGYNYSYKKHIKDKICIYVEEPETLEYILRMVKDKFSYICLIFEEKDVRAEKIAKKLVAENRLEIKYIDK
ncbi:hypothetical protein [Abyssisolibacter fermentans]|uniref:hypothetical protein n=1 Tax=Abyssisolibacter fermentans TaxID=1766203 RepID=UPI000833BD46|nr:hypothetical protein [Abyssisolibacter fermentans]